MVNASSEPGRLAVNGMSYSGRDGENANSALIVTITPEDYGTDSLWTEWNFSADWKKKAYELGQGKFRSSNTGISVKCKKAQNSAK